MIVWSRARCSAMCVCVSARVSVYCVRTTCVWCGKSQTSIISIKFSAKRDCSIDFDLAIVIVYNGTLHIMNHIEVYGISETHQRKRAPFQEYTISTPFEKNKETEQSQTETNRTELNKSTRLPHGWSGEYYKMKFQL